MPKIKRTYGWVPDRHDARDFKFALPTAPVPVPRSVDNTSLLGPVLDQLSLGSCGAHALAELLQTTAKRMGVALAPASRLFAYWVTRFLEGTVNEDSGVSIRDVYRAVNRFGYCDEGGADGWPYNIKKYKTKPPAKCFTVAQRRIAKLRYASVAQTPNSLQAALAVQHCMEFGFWVPASFESDEVAKTGVVPMPKPADLNTVVGGHAIALIDFDSDRDFGLGVKGYYRFRNSWGDWGDHGNGYMPMDMVHDRQWCSDFWALTAV